MRQALRGIAAAIVAGCALAGAVSAQSSPNYRMEHLGFAAGIATATSQSYQTSVIISPDTLSGASSACNTGLRVSLGLWSIAGTLPVPVELTVRQSPTDAQDVELTWTGADPRFQVYRGSSPSNISSALNLYQDTDLCAFTDVFANQASILFYLVVPRP